MSTPAPLDKPMTDCEIQLLARIERLEELVVSMYERYDCREQFQAIDMDIHRQCRHYRIALSLPDRCNDIIANDRQP